MLVNEGDNRAEMLIESHCDEGFEVAGNISCEKDLVAGIKELTPDVVVLDMSHLANKSSIN